MKTTILLFFLSMLSSNLLFAQMTTNQDDQATSPAVSPDNTKFIITGTANLGFIADKNADEKFNFNDYGLNPLFQWKPSQKMFIEAEIEIVPDAIELEYAKMSFVANPYLTIGVGRMLTPFGAYGERWEPLLLERFPNAPLRASDEYLPDDTHLGWGAMLGVDARGKVALGSSKLNYAVFLSNGPQLSKDEAGNITGITQFENLDDNNSNKGFGGRIGFIPFHNGSLEVGFSAYTGKAGDENDALYKDIGATAIALDLNYAKSINSIKSTIRVRGQFNSLTVDKAMYAVPDDPNGAMYTFDNTLQNYWGQISFRPSLLDTKILKNIELLFRYNSLTPPKDAAWAPKDENGKGGSITRTDIGLCYWLSWRTGLRLAYETTTLPDNSTSSQFLGRVVMGF
ncbi:MAG: hypothetical protein ABJB16_16325 [Saprospiraceae bacterium]